MSRGSPGKHSARVVRATRVAMMSQPRSVAISSAPSALRRFVDLWCEVGPAERGGRLYERLGLRPVFQFVAGLFGESLPPPSAAAVAEPQPGEWLRIYVLSRYHEILNLIALTVYTPFLVLLCLRRMYGFAIYCLILMLTHKAALLLERYKRARCDALLSDAGIVERYLDAPVIWRPKLSALPPVLRLGLCHWYFTPRRWETERLYTALGMGAFRAFVLRIVRATGTAPETDMGYERFVSGRSELLAFETQTRVAEATHLAGIIQHLPFAIGMAAARDVAGEVYVAFMLAVNLACVLLQRWHRVRVWPVVQRLRARADAGNARTP